MKYFGEETLSNLRHGGLVNLVSIVIIALATIILSLLFLVMEYMGGGVESIKEKPEIIVFLDDALDSSSTQKMKSQIEKMDGVKQVSYVSKQEALERFRAILGEEWAVILDGLEGDNPLPASMEVRLSDEWLSESSINIISNKLSQLEGVEEIRREAEIGLFARKLETALWVVVTILGITSAAIVFFSVMLTAYFRRDEIRIVRLVGATNGYVRIPLMLQGGTLGLVGSSIGILIFYGLFKLYAEKIGIVEFLSAPKMIILIILGTSFGLLGGLAPIRRYIE